MKSYPPFGVVMRQLRHEKAMSQEQLAEKMNMESNAYISRLESGKKQPTIEMLFRLAKALDVKPSDIVKLIEERDLQ